MNPFAGIASRQKPNGVTATGSTLRAALLMADNAVKQRAAQDFGGIGEAPEDALDLGLARMLHY